MNDKSQDTLCHECKKLEGEGRHTAPHRNLTHEKFIKISSAMGSADEDYYVCNICNQKWMHETGSCGCGWILITD